MTRSDLLIKLGTGFGGDDRARLASSRFTGVTSQTTRPQPDHHGQATEVMLSMSPPRPRVDEKFPSSAPEPSPRRRGSFVASLPIVAPARGSGDAAGAAHAHRAAAAHPARRRGEERPHARRHDGVEAPLRHCVRNARAAPPGRRRWPALWQPGLNCFLVRAQLYARQASISCCRSTSRFLICNCRRNLGFTALAVECPNPTRQLG